MKKIVIMTHALMAHGMKETAEFLAGDTGICSVCCFTEEPDPDGCLDRLLAETAQEDTLIVMTDLCGGSVNQKAGKRIGKEKFYLISGINLPLLLELVTAAEEEITPEFIRTAVGEAQKEIVFVNDMLEDFTPLEDDDFFEEER